MAGKGGIRGRAVAAGLSAAPAAFRALPGGEQASARIGEVVTAAVDKVVTVRWAHAQSTAAATHGTSAQRIDQLARTFAKEMATVGAVAGGAAAVPAVGTAAVIGTSLAELGWFTARSADLILSIAAVHGHTQSSVEQRRGWVLSVLAFGDTAAASFTKAASELGKGLGQQAVNGVPSELLRTINRKLGRTIVTKYGTKRGFIALGHVLPFGIGAVIGGSANYAFARSVAKHADSFFRDLPPALDGTPIDVTAYEPPQG